MSFRLHAILWAFALLAAAMATFGSLGILAAIGVALFWTAIFHGRTTTLLELPIILVVIAFSAASIARLSVSSQGSRAYSRHAGCLNNVHELAAALMRFTQRRGAFPAAATASTEGRPPRSWRVSILPQLDSHQTLFDQYRHNEPWDSVKNLALGHSHIDLYQCPADVRHFAAAPYTNYFAAVGRQTAWPPGRGCTVSEIKDDPAKTILLIEAVGREFPWSEPRDFTFDEAVALLTGKAPGAATHHRVFRCDGFFYKSPPTNGASMAFADGSTQFVALPMSKGLAVALLTVDGGEVVGREFNRLTQPQLDYALCYAFGAFVLLALLPASRFFRRKSEFSTPLDANAAAN